MHIKNMHEMIEKMTGCAKSALESNETHIGQYPISDVIEMIEELAEAEYYAKISKAMDEAEYGEDYDEDGRLYYRGQKRDSMGRFTSRGGRRDRGSRRRMGYEDMMMPDYDEDIWDRDMDIMRGAMYYGNQGRMNNRSAQGNGVANTGETSSSRYGYTHDAYMKEKQMHPGQSDQEKKMRMHKLNEHLEDLEEMAKETISGMSPEEKQAWKVKLNKIINM